MKRPTLKKETYTAAEVGRLLAKERKAAIEECAGIVDETPTDRSRHARYVLNQAAAAIRERK